MAPKTRHRRDRMMTDKVDKDGRVQVTARLLPEEVDKLDALKRLQERDSRSNVATLAIRDWMKRQLADPETAAQVEAELRVKA
jgi:hypothetical protein